MRGSQHSYYQKRIQCYSFCSSVANSDQSKHEPRNTRISRCNSPISDPSISISFASSERCSVCANGGSSRYVSRISVWGSLTSGVAGELWESEMVGVVVELTGDSRRRSNGVAEDDIVGCKMRGRQMCLLSEKVVFRSNKLVTQNRAVPSRSGHAKSLNPWPTTTSLASLFRPPSFPTPPNKFPNNSSFIPSSISTTSLGAIKFLSLSMT